MSEEEDKGNDQALQPELNELEQIESIDYFISTLSPEEIQDKIGIYKEIALSQNNQISQLIETVDKKVSKVMQGGKQFFTRQPVLQSSSSVPRLEDINQKHKEHQRRIAKLERESAEKIVKAVEMLEDKHCQEMNRLLEEHDEKVKVLSGNTERNQMMLNALSDSTQYISIQAHNKVLNQVSAKYKSDIDKYDEEISKLEAVIKDKYPYWINKTRSMLVPNLDRVYDPTLPSQIEDFISKLKNDNGNDSIINLVSQMQIDLNSHDNSDLYNMSSDKDIKGKPNEESQECINTITINDEENSDKGEDWDVQEFNRSEATVSRQVPFHVFKIQKDH